MKRPELPRKWVTLNRDNLTIKDIIAINIYAGIFVAIEWITLTFLGGWA
ncbi:hypothetical protein CN1A_6 [Clavibacter phage CN1A]|uniref:Uncharacterized protein n=1 Tax=Clavibacter phage CN1A TaxID=1406793 RepID=U5PT51_9CAUD|nr:hypothetical protein CN1A_6 [Clavibacter phage CN1A]AGY47115.1 hypothetical protein CN1A_6 [Clavibacter phage CN1A]